MSGCNSWRGHRWTRWSEAEPVTLAGMAPDTVILVQARTCERCAMLQKYEVTRLKRVTPTSDASAEGR